MELLFALGDYGALATEVREDVGFGVFEEWFECLGGTAFVALR